MSNQTLSSATDQADKTYQSASKNSPRKRAAREKTQDKILAAATRAFAISGFEATSLEEIASEVGYTKQTVIYHFGSKDGLLEAVIDEAVSKLTASFDRAVGPTSPLEPVFGNIEKATKNKSPHTTTNSANSPTKKAEVENISQIENVSLESPSQMKGIGKEKTVQPTNSTNIYAEVKTNSENKMGAYELLEGVVKSVFLLATREPEILGILREVIRLGGAWNSRVRKQLEPYMFRARAFLQAEMDAGRIKPANPDFLLLAAYSTVIGVATEVEVLRAMGVEVTLRETVTRRKELLGFLSSALK